MSKKDYEVIAKALYNHRTDYRERANQSHDPEVTERFVGGLWAWREIRNAIADALAQDSPRFDRARFIEACETGKDGR